MSLTNVGLLAGAATLAITSVGFAETRDANSEALAQIADLKRELAELKSQQGDSWLTEQRAAEIRSIVQDVLADADTRASLQSSGMTAGWDQGFFLASPDGNFSLKVSGQAQFRYVLNFRDIDGAVQGDRWTKGFENRRTKLTFAGHIADRSWNYKLQGNFNRDGGAFELEDAWLQKDFDNGLYFRAGQFKPPFLREELVSSSRQLAVERSLVNERYNQDFSQGIEVGWESDVFRIGLMFSDGIGEAGNFWNFNAQNSPWEQTTTEWAFTSRAEFLVGGNWEQFKDFTSWNGESFGLLLGAAVNWQRGEVGTQDTNDTQFFAVTLDASVEFGGFNLYGAFVYGNPDIGDDQTDPASPVQDRDEIAFIVQGGFMLVPDTFEIFGRFEWADPDIAGQDDLSVITAGVNWYWAKHSAKLTADVGFSLEDFGAAYASNGAGWLDGFNETEIVTRVQFQVLF